MEDFINDIELDKVMNRDGAFYALIENGRMLVKAPNIKYYRIPEDVYRIDEFALKDCNCLMKLDVPYGVLDTELEEALKNCTHHIEVRKWNWQYDTRRSEALEKEITEGWTDEYGFVYSQDRRTLLKAATVKKYFIPEGVEKIDCLAFVGCKFEELNIPYTCNLDVLPSNEWPVFGSDEVVGCIQTWEKPYSQEDEVDDSMCMRNEATFTDEHGVVFSENRRRLLWIDPTFDETEYHVPDGVITICSLAFVWSKHFLTLSVPSSVKVIGCDLYGSEGGRIIMRKD